MVLKVSAREAGAAQREDSGSAMDFDRDGDGRETDRNGTETETDKNDGSRGIVGTGGLLANTRT